MNSTAVLILLCLLSHVSGYAPHCYLKKSHVPSCRQFGLEAKSDEGYGDDIDFQSGPEKSRMTDFVAQYLGKKEPSASIFDQNNLDTATHLVAIPMEACHELLIELESVQRAILYHCPILLDACIPASMARLPLLYVQAKQSNSAMVTSFLADKVTELAQKHLYISMEDDNDEDSIVRVEDLNEDGFRPFTLTFQSLEIDGRNNNVLNTVALPNSPQTKRLQNFVRDLQSMIEAKGWKSALPLDPSSSIEGFRPRIPFMELPKSFNDNLNRFRHKDTEISEEDEKFLKAEEGGNGISPIFWCQWWDDTFSRNCRLREIGIYPRSQSDPDDISYSMFYLPHETIPLPDGTAAMRKAEQKFEKYQEERMLDEQREYEKNKAGDNTVIETKRNSEPDILMTKTRERLEDLYMSSVEIDRDTTLDNSDDTSCLETFTASNAEANQEVDDEEDIDIRPVTASPDDFIDDWMQDRIRKIIDSRESVKSQIPVKKDKPPIEDNPVFKAYKHGTLVPETSKRETQVRDLGPYPGRDHFVGIWSVDRSPTGFPLEEPSEETSENLVLRVDGTTAGGPILDPETRQKAAGGTWKFLSEENGEIRLRIRLVIPPKKERILVMEGVVDRISVNSDFPMTSKAFGIPQFEEKLEQARKSSQEDILSCEGQVYVEDAVTKKNRENIGSFSLMKLQGPRERRDYTITIPRPIRNQD